jgi:arylsulfatase A-like enzyme
MMRGDKSPNILFVFSDQHRWCDLGCSGNSEVATPHFDRFAREGLRIERCISNSPLCVPARGSLLTGLSSLKHGAAANDLPIRPGVESVATALGRAGYHTGYIGKWHLGGVPRDRFIPEDHRLGFTEWKACECGHDYMTSHYHDEENIRHDIAGYDAEEYTTLADSFIRRNAGTPWGLWLSWGPPHDPYFDVPQNYLDLYAGRNLPLRPNVPEEIIDRIGPSGGRDRVQMEQNLHGYYAHITALDEQFGRLLRALEETGQAENTIVVYTSDHGDMLGSQGWTNKQLPFEESIRVPLLLRGPDIRRGTAPASIGLTDLPVSLLALANVEMPGADGRDLRRIFTDPSPGADACYIFDLIPCHQATWRGGWAWRGVRTARHTYACREDGTPWLLFDNDADPFQLQNLVDQPETAALQRDLHARTAVFADKYDALTPWQHLISANGLTQDWNKSQRYFGLPELPPA